MAMKTEIIRKVIKDRVGILNSFLETIKDKDDSVSNANRDTSSRAVVLFTSLGYGIEEYINLINGGGDVSDLSDKIRELTGMTIVPLIEHNKQKVDSYNQIIHNLQKREEEIKNNINMSSDGNGPLKEELNGITDITSQYEQTKKATLDYVQEYESALEEIKNLFVVEDSTEESEQVSLKDYDPNKDHDSKTNI